MLDARRQWTTEEGLDPDVIENVYRTLVDYFIQREMRGWRRRDWVFVFSYRESFSIVAFSGSLFVLQARCLGAC